MMNEDMQSLEDGALHRFADWPIRTMPIVAAGVYTIWDAERFLYVGIGGHGKTEEVLDKERRDRPVWKVSALFGLADRLNSHASGRRSGDQFCIYVCDRLVLPVLTPAQIREVGSGKLSLDDETKTYIKSHLTFRFIEAASGKKASAIEREIQAGALEVGRPFLNPK
jgi:hypothetical protein